MRDKLRMAEWLLLGLAFYALAIVLGPIAHIDPEHFAQLQLVVWKSGHVTLGAFLGYWIDRHLFGRVDADSDPGRLLSRAIVVAAAAAGLSLGL